MPLLIICKKENNHTASLLYNDKKIKCLFGFSGIGKKLREGDGVSPKGLFSFTKLFYREDRIGIINANIEKKRITRSSFWSVDSKDPNYNQYCNKSIRYIHEKLYRKDTSYDLFLNLNYNYKNPKKKRGSAIFLHCSDKNKSYTEGCIAIEKKNLLELIKLITPTTRFLIK